MDRGAWSGGAARWVVERVQQWVEGQQWEQCAGGRSHPSCPTLGRAWGLPDGSVHSKWQGGKAGWVRSHAAVGTAGNTRHHTPAQRWVRWSACARKMSGGAQEWWVSCTRNHCRAFSHLDLLQGDLGGASRVGQGSRHRTHNTQPLTCTHKVCRCGSSAHAMWGRGCRTWGQRVGGCGCSPQRGKHAKATTGGFTTTA